jgi:SAM-dependent methyltransferase
MPRDWDRHYTETPDRDSPPEALLVQAVEMLPPGDALDLACGAGRNAIYLARLGWRVTAVDSSPAAIRRLRERAGTLEIDSRVADLERREFAIQADRYDLIGDFYYLQRDLFPQIRQGVRPGGMFVGAIHLEGSCGVMPGELLKKFAGWKVSYYSERPDERGGRASARVIARRA